MPAPNDEERLRNLERALDAISSWAAQGFVSMREDVHKSVAWLGIEFYDLRPALSALARRLDGIERRLGKLEDHAASDAEERPARQHVVDTKLEEINDRVDAKFSAITARQDRRWRYERIAWGILIVLLLLIVGVYIGKVFL